MTAEARFFPELDLKTVFHYIRVQRADIEKTSFNTKYGQFEYLVMPMGLCDTLVTFQSVMKHIFYDCVDDFLAVYMDDLLIFSKDERSHLRHIELVLSRIKERKMYMSLKKCEFLTEEMEFLELNGEIIRLRVHPNKVKMLKMWPKPSTLIYFRSVLGLMQFFRRFIKKVSEIAAPIANLTKKNQGIQNRSDQCDRVAEEGSKKLLQYLFRRFGRNRSGNTLMRPSSLWEVR